MEYCLSGVVLLANGLLHLNAYLTEVTGKSPIIKVGTGGLQQIKVCMMPQYRVSNIVG